MSRLPNALENAEPIYILPKDNVVNQAIIPAFKSSEEVSIMMGFFSSASIAEIAPGLASYLRNSSKPLRLIVSPFINAKDQEALINGTLAIEDVVEKAFADLLPTADDFGKHTLSCLAWLIAEKRLAMKIAVMKNALFHTKVWWFKEENLSAVLHGSANLTSQGLSKNREQLSLAKSWTTDEGYQICRKLSQEFESLWAGTDLDCVTKPLSQAISEKLLIEFKGDNQPTEHDYERLWRKASGLPEEPVDADQLLLAANERKFEIPDWLEYDSGEYTHQGQAIRSWEEVHRRGILEMCTGSGKTLTALVAACKMQIEIEKFMIVVTAPYKVLIEQWCKEIELFGIKPSNLSNLSGPKAREKMVSDIRRRLRLDVSQIEAVVVSNDILCSEEFIKSIEQIECQKLLIADECHNLGAASFVDNPPECFDHRLGLSATPVRQYDDEGTDALFSYFGTPCFRYTLEDAIGNCLTPYQYHVRFVPLQNEEMDQWRELSKKISEHSWKIAKGQSDDYLNSLFRQRRLVLETAQSKIATLEELLENEEIRSISHTLVYATDKHPTQLDEVNELLDRKGVIFHQLTADETSRGLQATHILDEFKNGNIQVLTAKRVLDEGVNVPEIMRAYILASTTVRRQWVQRRGRLLRNCKSVGKEFAIIYDLVAVPPEVENNEELDNDAKKMLNSELDRVWEFARLSMNSSEKNGPFDAVEKLRGLVEN